MFLGKGFLKICSKFTGEHPCRTVISMMLESNFIEITLRQWCSPVNLLHFFRKPFAKNTSAKNVSRSMHSITCQKYMSILIFGITIRLTIDS